MNASPAPILTPESAAVPVVYFIDDSATMREVIKLAFRKEEMQLAVFPDARSAFEEMEKTRPDVVISDILMPEKDGYEVCRHVKTHAQLGHTPVILVSGMVDRTVAEKALAVRADELVRKPFQPQELIARVKHLLKSPGAAPASAAPDVARAWSNLSAAGPVSAIPLPAPRVAAPAPAKPSAAVAQPALQAVGAAAAPSPATAAAEPSTPSPAGVPSRSSDALASPQAVKLRVENQRLDQLVKKLRAELEAERKYSLSLEECIQSLQETIE